MLMLVLIVDPNKKRTKLMMMTLLRERREKNKECTGKIAPLLIFFMSVAYSADIEIPTALKCWYDVDMTIHGSFSGLFSLRTTGGGKNRRVTVSHTWTL